MVATASSASEVKVASRPPVAATALPSLLPNEDDYRGTTTTTTTTTSPKKISASAQNIIDSFPLLDFMQSTVLTKLWRHHWRKYIRTTQHTLLCLRIWILAPNPLFYFFGFSHLRIRLSKQVHLLNHLVNFLEQIEEGLIPLRNSATYILAEMPAAQIPIFDAGHIGEESLVHR